MKRVRFLWKHKAASLWAVFLVSFLLRMYFSMSTDFTFDSYLSLNEARSIMQTLFPLHERAIVFPPVFYYFIALFYKSEILLNIVNSLLFSSITFLSYYIALHLSKDEDASLFSAFMASFIPVFFSSSLARITPYSLFIPLSLLFFLAFLKMKSDTFLYFAILLAFMLPRTSLSAVFIVPTLVLYFVLDKILNLHPDKKESELILLTVFVIPWAIFIFFKKPFEIYGLSAIYGNIPERIASTYFSSITLPQALTLIGVMPLLFGLFAIYLKIFNPDEKDRSAHMLISFVIVLALALWQRVLELYFALSMIGISLAILSAFSFKDLMGFIKKTKVSKEVNLISVSLSFLLVLTLLLPSISYGYQKTGSEDKSGLTGALLHIRNESSRLDESESVEKTVLSSPKEGYMIQFMTSRKPVLDESYILVEDADRIYEDIYKIYTTPFETDALSLLSQYEVQYIIIDDVVRKEFSISDLKYAGDKSCFDEIYQSQTRAGGAGEAGAGVKVYEVRCSIG